MDETKCKYWWILSSFFVEARLAALLLALQLLELTNLRHLLVLLLLLSLMCFYGLKPYSTSTVNWTTSPSPRHFSFYPGFYNHPETPSQAGAKWFIWQPFFHLYGSWGRRSFRILGRAFLHHHKSCWNGSEKQDFFHQIQSHRVLRIQN